jgi:hypothetical protein
MAELDQLGEHEDVVLQREYYGHGHHGATVMLSKPRTHIPTPITTNMEMPTAMTTLDNREGSGLLSLAGHCGWCSTGLTV